MDKLLQSKYNIKKLSEICEKITDGDHDAPDYKDSGILYLLSESVKNGYIDTNIHRYISQYKHKKLNKSALHSGNVLITKTGVYFGNSAVVPQGFPEANTIAHVGILELKQGISPYFVSSFFNCKYGRQQLRRRGLKATRPEIKLIEFNDIKICIPSFKFQTYIESTVLAALDHMGNAELFYKQAEELLNKELNITNIENTKPYSIRSFSNSFGKSKRLDAEYYQDKYDQIVNRLKTKLTLSNICHIYDENFNPLEKGIYKYVELSDIYSNGEIREPTEYFGNELPTRARRKIDNGQVLVSSIEGSLSSCALVTDYESSNLICSNGFYVVDSNTINSETLLVLFKSQYIQMLLKQRCSGTILTAISDDEFKNLPFIQIDEQVQDKIAQKVQESFRLRKQSKDLLEKAVKAVDLAIEQGEEKAIAWLNENTSE